MTTWPPPAVPVFPAGYGPVPADFTGWWVSNAAFLQSRVVARLREASTATALPSGGAVTTIGFDTVDEDPYSGWNSGSASWGPPAGYSGWYQVCVTLFTATLVAGDAIRVLVSTGGNSTDLATIQGSNAHGAGAEGQIPVYLIGGQDTVKGSAQLLNAAAGVNTSLTAGQQSTMDITWLGS